MATATVGPTIVHASPLLKAADVSPATTNAFVASRERALKKDAESARTNQRQASDDFLRRLNAVEENPAAASLVMPLISNRGLAQNFQPAVPPPTGNPLRALDEEDGDGATANGEKKKKHEVPRHRRVYKEVGATLGLKLMDHPVHPGVVVKELAATGSCLKHGVRVGDHIVKVNGAKPADHKDAMRMIDQAWAIEAEDPSKDRLKFSLADRTEDIVLRREVPPAAAAGGGGSGHGGRAGGGSGASSPPPDVGLTLIDNTSAGVGVVVLHVAEASPAQLAGLEIGHVLTSCEGKLSLDHKQTLRQIDAEWAAKGEVNLVVQLRKLTEGNVMNQRIGEMPINIVVTG